MSNSSELTDFTSDLCSALKLILLPSTIASAGPNHDDSRFYGYIPSLPVTVIFTVLFFFSTSEWSLSIMWRARTEVVWPAIHLWQSVRYRMWFLLLTAVFAGNFEVVGWAARTYSHFQPSELMPYLIQTVATINAPTPLIAAYFIIFAEIIRRLGPCYSRLKPRMCESQKSCCF